MLGLPLSPLTERLSLLSSEIMPTKPSDAWLGKTLGQGGRYQLDTLLGYGRSGRVYKALDRKLSLEGTPVYRALKFLAINLSERPQGREQFQRYVQQFTAIQDHRVIAVLDYGVASTRARNGQPLDLPFLVMEYVASPSLAEILEEQGPLPVDRALALTRESIIALQALHQGGETKRSGSQLVHGNLTPPNLFVMQQVEGREWIKVGDFGQFILLSRLQLPILTTTSQQQRAGAPIYAAPESFQAGGSLDGRADLYGLGCLLYQMLSGMSPFGPLSDRQSLEQWGVMHQSEAVRPLASTLNVPASVESLIQRCLQKRPADRFSTLKELDRALEQEQRRLQKAKTSAPSVISLEDLELTTDDTIKSIPPRPNSSLLSLIEDEVLDFLETALIRYNFRIRLEQERERLRISLYRKTDKPVDYAQVAQRITEQLEILNLPEIQVLDIESYPPGSPAPDWYTQIVLDTTVPEQIQSLSLSLQRSQIPMPAPDKSDLEIAPPSLGPEEEQEEIEATTSPSLSLQELDLSPELNLSQYCFVGNQLLLRTSLPTPPADVAQAVQFFHELRDFDKAQILPLLNSFFKNPRKTPRDDLPSNLQNWLAGLEALNEHKFKAVAIWLSRYCARPGQTLQDVQASLAAVVEAAVAERQQAQAPPASIVREMEPLIYQTHSHWLIQLLPWISGGVLILLMLMILPSPVSDALFTGLGMSPGSGMGDVLLRLILIGFTLVPIVILIAYRETQVLLTQSKAIVRQRSLFGKRDSSEVSLSGIMEVEVEQGALLKSLGGGSLHLTQRGRPPEKIFGVRNPEQLKQQILFLQQQRALGLRLGSSERSGEPASSLADPSGSFPPKNRGNQDGWLGRLVGDGGRYRLETVIGQGGMGKVYRAQDQKLSINVAIKFMLAGSQAGDDERERFLREMQACINLQDSRIVKVLDYGVTTADVSGVSSVPFLVMEFISSPTLETVMREHSRLPVQRAAVIAQQIAAALQTVHTGVVMHGARVQFVHRDLKPSNVFLLKDSMGDETIKLADFGLVKFQGSISIETLSRTGDFRGTPNYAAPEQCEGRRTIDKRGDIYSLGCILYEMLSGTNPFGLRPTATPMQWMYAQVNMEPRPFPPSLGIPASLEAIVLRCLAKEPSERFGTALELSSALNHLVR